MGKSFHNSISSQAGLYYCWRPEKIWCVLEIARYIWMITNYFGWDFYFDGTQEMQYVDWSSFEHLNIFLWSQTSTVHIFQQSFLMRGIFRVWYKGSFRITIVYRTLDRSYLALIQFLSSYFITKSMASIESGVVPTSWVMPLSVVQMIQHLNNLIKYNFQNFIWGHWWCRAWINYCNASISISECSKN